MLVCNPDPMPAEAVHHEPGMIEEEHAGEESSAAGLTAPHRLDVELIGPTQEQSAMARFRDQRHLAANAQFAPRAVRS